MVQTIIEKPGDLMGQEGLKIGPSDWMDMTQERVNTFAEATGDHQWICLLYTSPSPRDKRQSRMPSSA